MIGGPLVRTPTCCPLFWWGIDPSLVVCHLKPKAPGSRWLVQSSQAVNFSSVIGRTAALTKWSLTFLDLLYRTISFLVVDACCCSAGFQNLSILEQNVFYISVRGVESTCSEENLFSSNVVLSAIICRRLGWTFLLLLEFNWIHPLWRKCLLSFFLVFYYLIYFLSLR